MPTLTVARRFNPRVFRVFRGLIVVRGGQQGKAEVRFVCFIPCYVQRTGIQTVISLSPRLHQA